MPNPAHSGFSRWLTARLAEPDTRIAIAGAIPLVGAYIGHSISLTTLGWGMLVCAIMFVLPGPLAQPIIAAIEKETGLPPIVPVVASAPSPAVPEPPHAAPGTP